MNRKFLVFALALAGGAFAQQDFSNVEIKTIPVAGNIYMLQGEGGNIGVSAGSDGLLIVDDEFAPLAPKIEAALHAINPGKLRFVLNTHFHGDHTGGNAYFGKAATIIAQDNVRKRLLRGAGAGQTELPIITYDDSLRIYFNGEEIRVRHVGPGHTDGDSIIHFTGAHVWQLGDQFSSGLFPNIDLGAGGTVQGFINVVEDLLREIPAGDKVIPGHGPLSTRKELEEFHAMLVETRAIVAQEIREGKTLAQVQAAGLPEKWKSWSWPSIPTDRWLAILYRGLSPAATATADSPADRLPPWITQVTSFGERADWSHDGKKILFLSKTFGDAMELDLATGKIRNLTAHYPHHGYTRALYLANGDILLSGPAEFDPRHPGQAREQCFLSVLDKSLTKPAQPLGTKCFEGPAVSRKRMHIAWTHVAGEYPDEMPRGTSRIQEADIVYENGAPKLANQKIVLTNTDLPFRCGLESQNFRPPDEKELTFDAYGYQGTDVCGINLETKKVVDYSNSPHQYDEAEGIFPDGESTLVECDKHNHQGPDHVDLWKLKLDGSGSYTQRLTHFSDIPGYKASNPVVSDDGRFIAFQMAHSRDAAGVGHGIFILDLGKLPASKP